MNWFLIIVFGLILFFGINLIFFGRDRRRAPNVLNRRGWPKGENRGGERPNDEE